MLKNRILRYISKGSQEKMEGEQLPGESCTQ